jgi:hypothetical protein
MSTVKIAPIGNVLQRSVEITDCPLVICCGGATSVSGQTPDAYFAWVLFCGATAALIAPGERPFAAMFGGKVGYLTW